MRPDLLRIVISTSVSIGGFLPYRKLGLSVLRGQSLASRHTPPTSAAVGQYIVTRRSITASSRRMLPMPDVYSSRRSNR